MSAPESFEFAVKWMAANMLLYPPENILEFARAVAKWQAERDIATVIHFYGGNLLEREKQVAYILAAAIKVEAAKL